jgi:crotonobetainyl-CoA:carnitine CoA-transferase CaiB-like acyl-CoA transferase
MSGSNASAPQSWPEPAVGLPLSGFRIVELTTAWAGPMAGRILALMGAEVIHIESLGNLDSWRAHGTAFYPKRYPNAEAGARSYNRAALFNSQNTDKLSFSLDLKGPGGKDAFRDLIAKADGLITNFTPGMLTRLGFSNAELWAIKPDLVVLEMPAYGNSGPLSARTALGPTMEQVAGICASVGYGDGQPVSTGPAFLDPVGAFHGASAMLTALYHRERTGEGQHVEVPQVEAAMHIIGEHLIHAAETGRDPHVDGNRLDYAAPHDVFPAAGDDEWVAIAVADDAAWRALCQVMGLEAMADDPRFAKTEARVIHQRLLAEPLGAWTRARNKHDAAQALQEAGVTAAAVFKAPDALSSPYLNARGFSQMLDHPDAGRHLHQGLPFRLSGTPVAHRRAAPGLGEHNHYILKSLLGRNDEEVAELERAGTIASVPPGADAG